MSSLNQILRDLESVYIKETSTTERYIVLQTVEQKLSELRELTISTLADGKVPADDNILFRIRKIFGEQTNTNSEIIDELVHLETRMNYIISELVMDSLDVVELIMAIEEEFDTEISDEAAEHFRTVEDIVKVVTK